MYRNFKFFCFILLFIIFVPIVLLPSVMSNVEFKDRSIFIVVILYPLFSLILGLLISKLRANIFIALAISSISYIAVFYRYYNESAYIYVLIYAGLVIAVYTIWNYIRYRRINMKANS